MGASQRNKGAVYEREVVESIRSHGLDATKISGMYQTGSDIRAFNHRYIECRRRSVATGYESMNKIDEELDGDASLYYTRLDQVSYSLIVMRDHTLYDLLDEADNGELWPE